MEKTNALVEVKCLLEKSVLVERMSYPCRSSLITKWVKEGERFTKAWDSALGGTAVVEFRSWVFSTFITLETMAFWIVDHLDFVVEGFGRNYESVTLFEREFGAHLVDRLCIQGTLQPKAQNWRNLNP